MRDRPTSAHYSRRCVSKIGSEVQRRDHPEGGLPIASPGVKCPPWVGASRSASGAEGLIADIRPPPGSRCQRTNRVARMSALGRSPFGRPRNMHSPPSSSARRAERRWPRVTGKLPLRRDVHPAMRPKNHAIVLCARAAVASFDFVVFAARRGNRCGYC